MALSDVFGQVNIIGGTVVTSILAAAGNRDVCQLYNAGAATVYLGGAVVTVANGFPLDPGQKHYITGPSAVYGIVASGTIDVRYYYSA
jgi:hypothetical protein